MSTKICCDVPSCGEEIEKGMFYVTIWVPKEGNTGETFNAHHICMPCARKMLPQQLLDDQEDE